MADEDRELEFATKEDLEVIEKSPELKRVLNAMKAGVTKKFQEWSEKGKTSSKSLETRMKQLEDKLYEWEDWYAETFPEGYNPEEETDTRRNPNDKDKRKSREEGPTIQDVIEAVNKAGASFEKRLSSLAETQGKLSNAFTLSLDLIEQKFAHPEMDIQKVLKTAQEKGIGDFGDAYSFAYKDELIKKEVDTKVDARLKEEEAKRRTTSETGSGTVPLVFEKPKEAPKSFTDATQQFLKERASEEKK